MHKEDGDEDFFIVELSGWFGVIALALMLASLTSLIFFLLSLIP